MTCSGLLVTLGQSVFPHVLPHPPPPPTSHSRARVYAVFFVTRVSWSSGGSGRVGVMSCRQPERATMASSSCVRIPVCRCAHGPSRVGVCTRHPVELYVTDGARPRRIPRRDGTSHQTRGVRRWGGEGVLLKEILRPKIPSTHVHVRPGQARSTIRSTAIAASVLFLSSSLSNY